MGEPFIDANFRLVDHNGNQFDSTKVGVFKLIYFGFTHCPDVCPEELEKIAKTISIVEKDTKKSGIVVPIFISCDPHRDKPEVLKSYLEDFGGRFVGLSGTPEEVERVARQFRVYFKKSSIGNSGGNDYLLDHSIFIYLISPENEFIEIFGRDKDAAACAKIISEKIKN